MNDDRNLDPIGGRRTAELALIDPGVEDDSYWTRFRFRVMTRAADELFRRRELADVSVVSIVGGWSRMLAPAAALAAAIAGILLIQQGPAAARSLPFEEALLTELEDESLPLLLRDGGEEDGPFQFASERF